MITAKAWRISQLSSKLWKQFPLLMHTSRNPKDPLLLTSLIDANNLLEAREKSLVRNLPNCSTPLKVESYSGFLTVNRKINNHNLFFWYFPAVENPATAPVILWMSGGPGWSSNNALFLENGPFMVDSDGLLHARDESWTKEFSVVYLDQPVGTGFSYREGDHDLVDPTADQLDFLRQFLKLFGLEKRDFYIAVQSYGAKFAVRLATAILNEKNTVNHGDQPWFINLKGMSIGNGFLDNLYFERFGDNLYNHGVITYQQKLVCDEQSKLYLQHIQDGRMQDAAVIIDSASLGYLQQPVLTFTFSGLDSLSNLLYSSYPFLRKLDHHSKYLSQMEVKNALHVGDREFHNFAADVIRYMYTDIPVSVFPLFLNILKNSNLKILVHNGEFDLYIPYMLTDVLFRERIKDYANAERRFWTTPPDPEISGYVSKHNENLFVVMVRGAGHNSSADQPRRCLDLLTRFIRGTLFEQQ